MPYIQEDRKVALKTQPPQKVGELTYLIQQQILKFIQANDNSYATYAQVLGALEGAKADFIDRRLLPYERVKRDENGDVW